MSVISSTVSASISLASICLVLSSLLVTWIGSSTTDAFPTKYVYGNTTPPMIYTKCIAIIACFLVAFACFVLSASSFVNANYLISMPNEDVPSSFVVREVIGGSDFWQVGLRSLYLATVLLLWVFGPIPMLIGSVAMVAVLIILDRNATPLYQYK
ncbi:hypothetical protein M569_12238 [Genlisea aurea]|uniref:Uncharacterized protein n=1 Tax=Genlisea aurea TaxID=192259 RepID=S8DID6_9LAMI|nr:hypothetical protein M569_12238 [Genlisea aurea]